MDLRKLHAFLAVVEAGSINQAAKALHLTQPALSRQMHALEATLRLQIFESRRGRLHLTAAGRAFVVVARELSVHGERANDAVRTLATGEATKLVVAATPTTTTDLLAPFLATLGPTDPLVLTRQASHADIPGLLDEGVDFVVSPVPVAGRYNVMALRPAHVRAFVPHDHPWAQRVPARASLREVAEQRLLASNSTAASRMALDTAMAAAALSYDEIHACNDAATLQALAVAGHGVAILTVPTSSALTGIPIVDTEGVEIELLKVHLLVAWHPQHYAEETISRLARALQQHQSAARADDVRQVHLSGVGR